MRFKIDKILPDEAAELLSSAGDFGYTVRKEHLASQPDFNVAEVCRREQRVLVTLDLDFVDIRTDPPADYAGIVILRPRQQAKPNVLALLAKIVPLLDRQPVSQTLWIVDESGVRLRGPSAGR